MQISFFDLTAAIRSMATKALVITLAIFSAGCIHEDVADDEGELLQVGDMMPSFEVVTLDSVVVSSESLRGHAAVIAFFNTTCTDCRRELPLLQQLYEATDTSCVSWICIARAETAAPIEAYWQTHALTMPVAPQPTRDVYDKFARVTIPRIFVFHPDGRLSASFEGSEPIDMDSVARAITAAM